MSPEPISIQLASPCQANWDEMTGDERVRFCALCQKHVYELSGLTRPEIRALFDRPEGAPCVRFFERADGRVLTADCPVGVAEQLRRIAWGARARWAALVAGVVAILGLGAWSDREEPVPLTPIARVEPRVPAGPPPLPTPVIPKLDRPTPKLEPLVSRMRMGTIQVIKPIIEVKKERTR